MDKSKFNLLNKIDSSSEQDYLLKHYYSQWKSHNRNNSEGFTMIYESFKKKDILSKIDGGALKLYLFLSLSAKNKTGESWYSIEALADYFDVQSRTIDKWFKNLIDLNLIFRQRYKGKSHTTYLLPYSNSLIFQKEHALSDDYDVTYNIDKIKEYSDIYGEIGKIYHLFQWVTKKDGATPLNALLIITKRDNNLLTGHILYFSSSLKNQAAFEQSLEDENFYTFKTPMNSEKYSIQGVALPSRPSINTENNSEQILSLVEQLNEIGEEALYNLDELDYGTVENYNYSEKEEGD